MSHLHAATLPGTFKRKSFTGSIAHFSTHRTVFQIQTYGESCESTNPQLTVQFTVHVWSFATHKGTLIEGYDSVTIKVTL